MLFFVEGLPRPQGSKTAIPRMKLARPRRLDALGKPKRVPVLDAHGRPVVDLVEGGTQSSKSRAAFKAWREAVREAAEEAWSSDPWRTIPPIAAPVALTLQFVMPRPKSHYRSGKYAHELKKDAPVFCDKAPDLSKLVRAVEDSLSGVCFDDDRRVCDIHTRQVYGEVPGVYVAVEALTSA